MSVSKVKKQKSQESIDDLSAEPSSTEQKPDACSESSDTSVSVEGKNSNEIEVDTSPREMSTTESESQLDRSTTTDSNKQNKNTNSDSKKQSEDSRSESKSKKKGKFFKHLLFWNKKKSISSSDKKPQRTTHIVDSVEDLPEEWKKRVKKMHVEVDNERKFKVLLAILQFMTKDIYRMTDQPSYPRDRRPYASAETLAHARDVLIKVSKEDVKRMFRNVEFSGKGGFGRVFSSKDNETKKRVAIKKLPNRTEKEKNANLNEVGFLSECHHANIVSFLKALDYSAKDEVWIVTEFLEGGTLSEAVKVHQFSERHIAYVAREMLKALTHLHSLGLVHRDLKSGNVMMSIEGHIKLIDFGLCCDISDGPRRQMLGSPYWIPPEMIRRKEHSYPADIWSFAVCVLEMYLKEPPNSHSRLEAMYMAATQGLKSCIPSRASGPAKDFLKRCLERNPKKRATAEELLEHPFITQPKLELGIRDVLRGVFVSNSLSLSGI